MNIDYEVMQESNLVCRCLHDGLIPVNNSKMVVKGMNQQSIEDFLRKICRLYGSCAVLAKNGEKIIGFIRFYPSDILGGSYKFDELCIQWREKCVIKPEFDMESFPNKRNLSRKDLTIQCFQFGGSYNRNAIDNAYKGRGIAKKMLETLIIWAKQHKWNKIKANAINPIKPLLLWTGMYSIDRYKELGFKIVRTKISPGLREGIISQKKGLQGEKLQKMWSDYCHLTDDEAALGHEVELTL